MTIFQEHPALLPAFRRGERGALEAVYRRYASDVLRLLRAGFRSGEARVRGIADSQALLDAAQDVFVKAFGEAGRQGYDGVRPYRGYLLAIARNHRIDHLRKEGREVLIDVAAPEESNLVDVDSIIEAGEALTAPEASAEFRELMAVVEDHVSALDPAARQFVQLRFVEELGQIEIAERMAVTRRRVRTLESTVLAGLRQALRRRGLA